MRCRLWRVKALTSAVLWCALASPAEAGPAAVGPIEWRPCNNCWDQTCPRLRASLVKCPVVVRPIEFGKILVGPPDPPPTRRIYAPRPRWRLLLGGAVVLGGLALGSYGAYGLAVSQQSQPGWVQGSLYAGCVNTACADGRIYHVPALAALTGVALGGVLAGALLLAIPGRSQREWDLRGWSADRIGGVVLKRKVRR